MGTLNSGFLKLEFLTSEVKVPRCKDGIFILISGSQRFIPQKSVKNTKISQKTPKISQKPKTPPKTTPTSKTSCKTQNYHIQPNIPPTKYRMPQVSTFPHQTQSSNSTS